MQPGQLTPEQARSYEHRNVLLQALGVQAMIQPGQTQTFRVQYVGDPDLARSKHYYVTVAQLPVQMPQGQSAIQILYNFQVLVSVSPSGCAFS